MDLNAIVATINHNGFATGAAGFAGGLAAANYALLIQKLVGSKFVTGLIRKDPKLAKAIVAELEKDVDAVADEPAPAPAAAPAAAPDPAAKP